MKFKEQRHFLEFWNLDVKLRMILCDAEYYLWKNFGLEPTITSLFRRPDEQQALVDAGQAKDTHSVHCENRGADLRLFENNNVNLALESYLNRSFEYDHTRPHLKTCLIHEGTARHIHLQCLETPEGTLK